MILDCTDPTRTGPSDDIFIPAGADSLGLIESTSSYISTVQAITAATSTVTQTDSLKDSNGRLLLSDAQALEAVFSLTQPTAV